jgi:type VI secretion system protein ImpA
VEYPQGFDLAALLSPIAGDKPTGADLRADYSAQSIYYRMRDARAEARAAERAADAADTDGETTPGPPPQWRLIRELALKALSQSKDLETVAWLTEALIRSDGMVGLNAGFALMLGLVENFWDQLYPEPDEDGIITRVAPITGLNGESGEGTLIQPLRKLTLFTMQNGEPLGFWQYERSAELTTISDPDRLAQRLAAGAIPFADVENEAHATGATELARLRDQTSAAEETWVALSESLDRHAGSDSPPTRRVLELLQQIGGICRKYAPVGVTAHSEAPAAVTASSPVAASVAVPGQLANREDALRMLTTVAEYFRRTEPQSPIAYTLAEAVRRGRLSLPELLEEIVPDSGTRGDILKSLGIKPPSE